jgi:nucleoside-diphosphate-sugar epimerase
MYDLSKELKNKVVTITGANGYIGSALIKQLEGFSLNKIIRISRKKLTPNINTEDWVLDLNEQKSWIKIVRYSDIIIHLAGNTSILSAENNPADSLISSVLPIIHLVGAAKELSCKPRVIFASSVTIYGLNEDFPIEESHISNPITSYDLHKFFAEQQFKIASNNNLIDGISLRLANVYGPSLNESRAKDRGVLSKVTKMSFENKNPQVYGNGSYIRDYIYIDDVVSAFLYASIIEYDEIRRTSEITFNVASGVGVSVKDVFSLISSEVNKITGNKLQVKNAPWPKGVNEIEKRNFIGSAERLKLLSGWTPSVSLEDGVCSLVDHYSKEYI